MLMVSRYSKDYVDACRAKVAAQLASSRKLRAAQPPGIDNDRADLSQGKEGR